MALRDQIFELVEPLISKAGLVLEEVQVQTPGKHRFVTVIVDSETGLNLDQVTDASRLVGEAMDGASFMGDAPYTLEVTSPGVDRPLTAPRHWRKNVDRLVKIIKLDGEICKGRISSSTEEEVTLDCCTVAFADIKRATIEVEFNRPEKKER
ncbi:MAG: ribosome maturation factor RimP [Candidatus Nanopelagicaceae bacterium]|jgi:ribosome maturation factor RimP